MKSTRTELFLFWLVAIILIALEAVSAILAYETIGAVASSSHTALGIAPMPIWMQAPLGISGAISSATF